MKRSVCIWIGLALCMSCGDSYTPPAGGPIVVDNNQMGTPAGSAEVAVGFPSGPLLEGGAPVTVTVALKLPPMAPVTIALASSDEAAGTASPATLTFDMVSWATPQTVTLTPVDDEVATGDKAWELRFELTSDDVNFAGKPVAPLKLTTIDNDAAPTIVAAPVGAPQTSEAGGAATITVQLSKQPKSDVLIPITLSDPAEADLNAATMTFTALNWNIAQTVTVTGKDDGQKDGDKAYKVLLGAANSTDEEFNGIGPTEVALTNIDGVCGNGTVDGAEACEPDGSNDCELGQMDCMVCNNACQLVPGNVTGFCGDGVTQFENAEECDEPTAPCAYGEETCQACSGQCKLIPGVPAGRCGDGTIQAQFEQCDAPEAPCPYGQMSCMTCRSCQSVPGQVTGLCGDGQVQAASGEECDGAATVMCGGQGTITCNAQCKNDRTQCLGFVQVVGGSNHGCALLSNGRAGCWGSAFNVNAVTTNKTGIVAIAAESSDTCMAAANRVTCYGRGYLLSLTGAFKQLSIDGRTNDNFLCGVTTANQVACASDLFRQTFTTRVPAGSFVEVEVGSGFACARSAAGALSCWDNVESYSVQGTYKALGIASSACLLDLATGAPTCIGLADPTPLLAPTTAGFVDIDTESRPGAQLGLVDEYACAVSPSNGLVCWGTLPTLVPASEAGDFVKIDAAPRHVCAVRSDGTAKCWGNTAGAIIPAMIP